MEKVYKTSHILAYLMLVLAIVSTTMMLLSDNSFALYDHPSAYVLRDCLFFTFLFLFFFVLKLTASKDSKLIVAIKIGLVSVLICLLATIVYAVLVNMLDGSMLFEKYPTPAKDIAHSVGLLPFYEPDVNEYPTLNESFQVELICAKFEYGDLKSCGALYVLFVWLASWLTLIVSFFMLCGKFGKKSIQRVTCVTFVTIMVLSILLPEHHIITIPVFWASTFFFFAFAWLKKFHSKGKDNPFEEVLLTPSEKKTISQRKKAAIVIIPIVVILITIITGVVISRNNKIKEENKYVEYLTKRKLVWYQCVGKLYQSAYEDLNSKINDENVTSSGYVGEGASPSVWEWYIQDQKKALDHLMKEGQMMLFDENYTSLTLANDSLGTQLYHDLDGFIDTWKNTRIVLSKRNNIGTDGDTKMWRYTEINSGVEFTACRYQDNMIEIRMTEEGTSKAYSRYVEQYFDLYMDEVDNYNQIVEEKKQQNKYEEDIISAMIGASLLGGLY